MKRSHIYSALLCVLCPVSAAIADSSFNWSFDGGTIAAPFASDTDAIGGLDAVADGTVVYAAERAGGSGSSSVELSSNGFLRVSDADGLSGMANGDRGLKTLAVEAWIYPTIDHAGSAQIVRTYSQPTLGNVGYEFYIRGDERVGFAVFGVGGTSTVTSGTSDLINNNAWNHIKGAWDGEAGTISVTVNGIDVSIVSATTLIPQVDNDLGIGALIRPNNTTGQFFTGRIDDISITGTTLEPLTEIAKWDFTGTDGAALVSDDGTDGAYLGFDAVADVLGSSSLTYSSDAPASGGGSSANFGNTGTGNDDGAILVVEDHPSLTGHYNGGSGFSAYEVELWFKHAEVDKTMQLFRKTDAGELGFYIVIQSNNTVKARLEDASGDAVSQVASAPLTLDNAWHHVRAGYDLDKPKDGEAPNFYLFLDGVETSTAGSVVDETMADTVTQLGIGGLYRDSGDSKGQYFNGLIDEVIIRAAPVSASTFEDNTTDVQDWYFYSN